MELELIMLSIRLVLHLEDHGLRLHLPMLLIWLTQMDICMELDLSFLRCHLAGIRFGGLYQIMVPGVSLLMGMFQI